ncbi:MAG: RIP metalloprotease RseP [Candidatus Omnitrophota bacterium]|nr:MAG: RIP metalloprotease RseP [Candidatus Omnitrophota bacterium]
MLGFVVFAIIVSILIIAHEFGHFLAARRAGIRVEKFAIGFGPVLMSLKRGDLEFLIRLVPLGGYVKMAGDIRSQCQGRSFEFFSRSVGTRTKIIFFGPLFNYLLAMMIFWIVFMVGFPYPDTFIGAVKEDSPAQKVGILQGDKILQINNKKVGNWIEVSDSITDSEGTVEIMLLRNGKVISFELTPQEQEATSIFGQAIKRKMIGIASSDKIKIVRENVFVALYKGIKRTFTLTAFMIKGIAYTIMGKISVREAIAGPVAIYYVTSEMAKVGVVAVLVLMGSLSVSLTIVNLIPLPVLDGGHLLFLFLEKIRRRPLTEKTEDILTRVGIAILFFLVVVVFYNDIYRFGPKILGREGQTPGGQSQTTEP